MPGEPSPEYIAARRVLLDALDALRDQLDALVLVGAQAIYLHTGDGDLAVAPYTTDADIALDPADLHDDPKLADVMTNAGFVPDAQQPGVWRGNEDVTIDLMVPEAIGGRPGKRAAEMGLHGKRTARNAPGLEGALVDRSLVVLASLEHGDNRRFEIKVAGPCALLIAKLHKIWERRNTPRRLEDKDALDVLRILRAMPTAQLASSWRELAQDGRSSSVTTAALAFLQDLFDDADALGCRMAARALELLEDPAEIAASAAALAGDLLGEIEE